MLKSVARKNQHIDADKSALHDFIGARRRLNESQPAQRLGRVLQDDLSGHPSRNTYEVVGLLIRTNAALSSRGTDIISAIHAPQEPQHDASHRRIDTPSEAECLARSPGRQPEPPATPLKPRAARNA